ncbi:hypothetical protein ACFXKC_28340 [Streptomyces sp. NPDC059340]|uniref:hypothetical protein n=1 Tax=Streptomyces sp. NPDC059340 TaxID=3346806 RepID=UPI003677EB0B
MYQNATREQIIAALREGKSVGAISRELRVDRGRVRRLRDELGMPVHVHVQQPLALEEKWEAHTRPVDGGHLEWTGERGTSSGTPVMRYKGESYSPAAIAFRIEHDRSPKGQVFAECGFKHCIAPGHVNDEPGRMAARKQLRRTERKPFCRYGHDQAEHGRYESDGVAYCEACKVDWARGKRVSGRPCDVRLDIVAMLHDGVSGTQIARRLHVAQKTVAAIRAELGLPTAPSGRRAQHASVEDAFLARVTALDEGHARWPGKTSRDGVPLVLHRRQRESVYRVAFRVHYGRNPEGLVRPGCGMPGCVAGAHLEDRVVRERTAAAFEAIFGTAA